MDVNPGVFVALGALLILFLILAFVFMRGEGGFLIAGYNTMPEEEKARFDEPALCKFMGKIMLLCALAVLCIAVFIATFNWLFFILGVLLILGPTIFAVYWINTGNHFKH